MKRTSVEPDTANGQVCLKHPADDHESEPAQVPDIKRHIRATAFEPGEWQTDFPPRRFGDKALTVGLPGTGEIRRSEMQAIVFSVAENVEGYAGERTRVDRAATRSQIERGLYESTVVLKAYGALHSVGGAAMRDAAIR